MGVQDGMAGYWWLNERWGLEGHEDLENLKSHNAFDQ